VPGLEVEAPVERWHRGHEDSEGATWVQQLQRRSQLVDIVSDVFEHADVHNGIELFGTIAGEQLLRGDLARSDR